MPTIKSIAGQTWIDITLQQLGDEERLFELCDLNDAGITDDLLSSTVIQAPNHDSNKKGLVTVMKERKPASIYYAVGDPQPEGIEYWRIEYDFEVG